jgi:L-alanine-DL-glutamate epimerase-like enolase superfamily enzyme
VKCRSLDTVQAIAAFDLALWDLKAKKVGLPLGKLIGAYRNSVPTYNTSGGCLNATKEEVIANVDASLGRGIGGIKLKVGQPRALARYRAGA